jgi:hypothetical protein
MGKINRLASRFLFLMILPILFIGLTDDAFAKKKKKKISKSKVVRSYNPKKTKNDALNTIRSNSEELSALAGIEASVAAPVAPVNKIDEKYSDLYEIDRTGLKPDEEGEDLAELEAEDDVIVNLDDFKMMWMNYLFEGEGITEIIQCGIAKQDIMNEIMDWLGTPYLFGGTSSRAIDCSAFVRAIYQKSANILLPRTAREQSEVGIKVARKNLEYGDLIFFNTRKAVRVSHVGIYLGDNLFVHASSRYGVTVSSLESDYYDKRFIGAKRLTQKDAMRLSLENNSALQGQ